MQNTMMDFPLTLAHILKRAGQLFGNTEIVSRLPDKSLHRYRYRDFHRRALALGGALDRASADRLAAVITGIRSLAQGASATLARGPVAQVLVEMERGYLLVGAVSGGAAIGVVSLLLVQSRVRREPVFEWSVIGVGAFLAAGATFSSGG